MNPRNVIAAMALIASGQTNLSHGDDIRQVSPAGTFTLTQTYAGDWTTRIRIQNRTVEVTDKFLWSAVYHISPDDRYIFRIQKIGSGENIGILYRLDPNGMLWRMDQNLDDRAFSFLEDAKGISRKELYHTGMEFGSWNMKAGWLGFRIHGTFTKENGRIQRELIYDLKRNRIRVR